MENILVVDANARVNGKRYSTLDVIGVGPRLITSLFKYYGFNAVLHPYENVVNNPKIFKNFDAIAISFMVSDFIAVNRITKLWRKYKENTSLIVLGGPGTLSNKILSSLEFDLAFIGESEYTFHYLFHTLGYKSLRDLVQNLRNEKKIPKGLAIKFNRKIVDGGLGLWTPRELLFKVLPEVEDLKNYPYYWACRIYVEVVRGCSNFYRPIVNNTCNECKLCVSEEFSKRILCPVGIPPGCGYCNVPLVYGYVRSRNIYSIAEEVRKLLDIGVTRIVLSAPDFLDFWRDAKVQNVLTNPCNPRANLDAIEKLFEELTKFNEVVEGLASISIENIKACLVDKDVVEILGKYLKGTAVYIGLETCSNKLLKSIGRPSTCEEVLNAIKLLSSSGLRPYVYLMHGLPYEEIEDLKKTIEIIPTLMKLNVEKIVLYKFRPLPRSAFESISRNNKMNLNLIEHHREKLKEIVKDFNKLSKENLIGRHIDIVIASQHHRYPDYLIGYPLHHGPVTLVKTSKKYIGYVARTRITRVLSDRIVLGEIIYLKRKIINSKHV